MDRREIEAGTRRMLNTWDGTPVRHEDGRTGTLRQSLTGWCFVFLTIWHEGERIGCVQLNTDGPDSGDDGWSFQHIHVDGSEHWWPLKSAATSCTEDTKAKEAEDDE